jgi:hypothetical protein
METDGGMGREGRIYNRAGESERERGTDRGTHPRAAREAAVKDGRLDSRQRGAEMGILAK